MTQYRNPWHDPMHSNYGPTFYETTVIPRKYRGYLIYHRIAFDVVKDGVCVGQYHGLSGAHKFIDTLHGEGGSEISAFNRERVAAYFLPSTSKL